MRARSSLVAPVAAALVASAGCVGAPPQPRAAGGAVLLPGPASSDGHRWYADRLDRGPRVVAGLDGPRFTESVTRTSGGLRVGFDGRVRDTLTVRSWSESVQTGVR